MDRQTNKKLPSAAPVGRERRVRRLKEKIETVSEVREGKVEPIRRALAQGTYRVKPDEVAKAMVDEAANDALHRGKCGLNRWPQKSG